VVDNKQTGIGRAMYWYWGLSERSSPSRGKAAQHAPHDFLRALQLHRSRSAGSADPPARRLLARHIGRAVFAQQAIRPAYWLPTYLTRQEYPSVFLANANNGTRTTAPWVCNCSWQALIIRSETSQLPRKIELAPAALLLHMHAHHDQGSRRSRSHRPTQRGLSVRVRVPVPVARHGRASPSPHPPPSLPVAARPRARSPTWFAALR
jgi:hypothetical protein